MLPEWFFVDYCSIFCGSSHSMHICYHCCLSHTESVGPTTGFKVYCWKTVAWCACSVCERAAGCILCLLILSIKNFLTSRIFWLLYLKPLCIFTYISGKLQIICEIDYHQVFNAISFSLFFSKWLGMPWVNKQDIRKRLRSCALHRLDS